MSCLCKINFLFSSTSCFPQMMSEPTHKNGRMLDLLFTYVSDLLDSLTVLGCNQ